uniref:Uncharacterized protein n=1 Tax=Cacopsylla melanoneura TaxID=428564 RepID=A0A8D8R222_9HEMI
MTGQGFTDQIGVNSPFTPAAAATAASTGEILFIPERGSASPNDAAGRSSESAGSDSTSATTTAAGAATAAESAVRWTSMNVTRIITENNSGGKKLTQMNTTTDNDITQINVFKKTHENNCKKLIK